MHQGGPCGTGPASLSSAHEAVVRLPHEKACGAALLVLYTLAYLATLCLSS